MDMPYATRIGDGTVGTCDIGEPCCAHGRAGTNGTGSPNVRINGIAAHRLGDSGSCNCPHGGSYVSTSASPNVRVNGIPLTRIGDETTCTACGCTGSHVSGSPNVRINGG